MDPAVRRGILPSGMAYYCMANAEPPNRAELMVVIKTGSVHEEEHERGVAHMLEHLMVRKVFFFLRMKCRAFLPPSPFSCATFALIFLFSVRRCKGESRCCSAGGPLTPGRGVPDACRRQFRASTSSTREFEVIQTLEGDGIQFGAHQNAYTSFDETVYFFHVPLGRGRDTGDGAPPTSPSPMAAPEEPKPTESAPMPVDLSPSGLLPRCCELLAALVLEARVTDADVEAERSIVVEEWRSRQGASQRWSDKYFEELLAESRYAKRMPIGLLDVIRNVSGADMRSFYSRRYHPSLMAVIAVGDFKGHEGDVVQLLKDSFGSRINAHWESGSGSPGSGGEERASPPLPVGASCESPGHLPPEPPRGVGELFGRPAR